MGTRRRPKLRAVRASDLAKMAACEQKLVYEKRYGERFTRTQRERIGDGNHGHARYLREAFVLNPRVSSSEKKPWCFIATELWGERARETEMLRSFRDGVLRRYWLGRVLMRAYYRSSPAIAAWLARCPHARQLAKLALMPVVAAARFALGDTR